MQVLEDGDAIVLPPWDPMVRVKPLNGILHHSNDVTIGVSCLRVLAQIVTPSFALNMDDYTCVLVVVNALSTSDERVRVRGTRIPSHTLPYTRSAL